MLINQYVSLVRPHGSPSGITGGDIWAGAAKGANSYANGAAINMLVGHVVGLGMRNSTKAATLDDGVYIYDTGGKGGWITFGNVIIGPEAGLSDPLFVGNAKVPGKTWGDHERGHIPQGTYLGPGYIPSQILSLTIGGVLGKLDGMSLADGSHKYGVLENATHPVPAGW